MPAHKHTLTFLFDCYYVWIWTTVRHKGFHRKASVKKYNIMVADCTDGWILEDEIDSQ